MTLAIRHFKGVTNKSVVIKPGGGDSRKL